MTLTRRILDEKRRFIYPLVAAVILNAAVFVAVVYPLSMKVAGGEAQASAAASALADAHRNYEAARATVTGKDAADKELKKFYGAVLPPDQSEARRLLSKVDDLAAAAGVTKNRSALEVTQERGSELGKLTATVTLTGDYRNIRRLIYALETSPDFLILESVVVVQGSERDQGLNVTATVATYFRMGGHGN